MLVRIQPGQPISICRSRSSITERGGSNTGDEGVSPSASANFQGVMSVADGLAWNEEDGSAILSTLTIFGRQADISWLHLSRKQDRHRRGRSVTDAFRHLNQQRKEIP